MDWLSLERIALGSRIVGEIEEEKILVAPEVAGACELLGLDPLYVANEGRMVIVLPAEVVGQALDILARYSITEQSSVIGKVGTGPGGRLALKTSIGSSRLVEMLPGEQLPRIC